MINMIRQLFTKSKFSLQGFAIGCESVATPCRSKGPRVFRLRPQIYDNLIISNDSRRIEGRSPKNYRTTLRQGVAAAAKPTLEAKPRLKQSTTAVQSSLELWVLVFGLLFLTGCNVRLPGQPTEAERWRAPADVSDFNQLYQENCAGCHGADGRRGAARSLNDSLYLSFIPDVALQQVVSEGRPGTNMPAFAQKAGGSLTDKQITLLITGIRSKWARPDDFKGQAVPSYSIDQQSPNSSASHSGDPGRGAAAYQTYCASCHGAQGTGGSAGSIVDPNFLTMVSDQGLRTTVVVGRADLGKPDWRSNLPGHPMSMQEIDDVVAWLISHRQLNRISQTGLR